MSTEKIIVKYRKSNKLRIYDYKNNKKVQKDNNKKYKKH